jgi:hypothetical protein
VEREETRRKEANSSRNRMTKKKKREKVKINRK